MARRTKEEAEQTRRRILASALSLFVKNGYDRTTFTQIAARLKLTKGAVYWHFATKEALLIALVDEMLEKFHRRIDELMPKGGLTFPAVAEMMVANAQRLVNDPKSTAFFMLMKTQIRWGEDSMAHVREELMSGRTAGPYHAFLEAIGNDIAAGRVRGEINGEAVATVCMSMWEGMVQAKIGKFLRCDLTETLKRAFDAVWKSIRAGEEA